MERFPSDDARNHHNHKAIPEGRHALIVCHLTTVHSRNDNRIALKQCAALGTHHKVHLIVADGGGEESREHYEVHDVGCSRHRAVRMLVRPWLAFQRARSLNADVCHIHDPELLPLALLHRLRGATVVYDVHEDYGTAIDIKVYLPRWLRWAARSLVGWLEKLAHRHLHVVLAERYYAREFPGSITVLNYPDAQHLLPVEACLPDSRRLIYTGNVTIDRGALQCAQLSARLTEHDEAIGAEDQAGNRANPPARGSSSYEVRMVGRCTQELADRLHAVVPPPGIVGVDRYVPFEEIVAAYREGAIAGLALFPAHPHYAEKELTKFFEYMAVGLPILCTRLPAWKALIEDAGVGFCVDPDDRESVLERVAWLEAHPEAARAMGRKGKQLVRDQYDWRHQAAELLRFYETLEPAR